MRSSCLLLLLAALACGGPGDMTSSASPFFGVGTSPTVIAGPLVAVGSDADADGFVDLKARFRGSEIVAQELHLQVHRLDGGTAFQLVVDGNVIDEFTTTPGGTFEAVYEPDPKGSHRLLPAQVTPVTDIQLVEIKNAATGETVLRGEPEEQEPPQPECEFALSATGADPDAQGEVKIEVETEDGITEQSLEVQVENLAPSTAFKLFVDGAEVATFTTDAAGKAKVAFSSNPESGELPLPPGLPDLSAVQLVEIRSADGAVVLTGTRSC